VYLPKFKSWKTQCIVVNSDLAKTECNRFQRKVENMEVKSRRKKYCFFPNINLLLEKEHVEFYVLLTVHLGIIFVNNQLDARFFFMHVYFYSLYVSGIHVPIIRRINRIDTINSPYDGHVDARNM
jgi:hypothetical protein